MSVKGWDPNRATEAQRYLRMLVATGRECDHPLSFRLPPPFPSGDPQEFECAVCHTVFVSGDRYAKGA